MNHCRSYLFFLLTLLFNISYSQAPSFNFQKLGSEEGLHNANIFSIEQHENGLMYFTTQNGIYYYDGYSFHQLGIDSLKSNALINGAIKNRDEIFLSLRDEGIATFNLRQKNLSIIPQLKLKDNNADVIIVNERFAFLLISRIKVLIVDLKTGKVLDDHLKKGENLAFSLFKTKEGKILLGRSDGLYDITEGRQIKLPLLNSPVYCITEDKEGRLLLGSAGKIFIFKNGILQQEITPVFKNKSATFHLGGVPTIDKILSDEYGRIWFTSYPEETLYLYENNAVFDLFEILDIPASLIKCIYKDSKQNIWIGTNSDGVYYVQNPFFNSINFSFNGKALSINQVFLKSSLLVAATSNGLYGLNLNNYQTKVLSKPDETFVEPISNIRESDGVIYYSKISEISLFPTIFFAADHSYKFKPVVGRNFYPLDDKNSIKEDSYRNILLCNGDGSKVIDTLITFDDYRILVNSVFKNEDELYVGTSNGLFIYNFKTKKCDNIVRSELNFNINDIALINNRLYAAHEGGITDIQARKLIQQIGNFRLNSVKKIKQFNEQIWLATLDGVFVCDLELNPLKTLNKSNGLLSNSVNDITFSDENIGIATARGVSVTGFRSILRYNAKLAPVTIQEIISNGKVFSSPDNSYSFKANEENISINFCSPLFNKPNKQFFKWRIDGGEWKYFSNPSFETSLSGGNHEIEVSASADNIVWSDPTTLKITKAEKLTEKQSLYWLFTLGTLLLIIIISSIWIRRVKSKAKKRLKEEQQVNLLKHQAMNSLLSPHFIFNSLTSIQNYINTNNGLRASEYLAKFSRLIRMIIEKAAQSHISLHDELARLTYYLELEKERFKNKFDYTIHLDEDINTHEIMIPNMIIQPYVENCIIHGILPKHQHGTLALTFKKAAENKLLITIEDNGIGLIKAKEYAKAGHKSLGTSTIQNILEINSKLSGKKQKVTMTDKSTIDEKLNGTIIYIELEL